MLQFSGEERLPQPRSKVWERLTDVEFLANCLPEVESTQLDESGVLVCRVRPGLSFAKGTLKVRLDVQDQKPMESVRIRIDSKGIGAAAVVNTSVKLADFEQGTVLTWDAEVSELGGLFKPIPRTLISAAAQKVSAEGWKIFRDRLV